MKSNRSEKLLYCSIAVVCIISTCSFFFPVYERMASGTFNSNKDTNTTLNNGVAIETSIASACNVGLPEKPGASDVVLAMNVAQCQGAVVANLKITNATKKRRRNIEIACVQLACDGSMIGKEVLSIAEEIPPSTTISVDGLTLKALDEKAARIECAVLGAERF